MTNYMLLATYLGAVIGFTYILAVRTNRVVRKLPKGPPTLPLIGNLHQMPTFCSHIKFTEWAKEYGGIFSLRAGSHPIFVITDRKLVKSVLDKNGRISSHRPAFYLANKLMTKGDNLLLMQPDNLCRMFRAIIHQNLNGPGREREQFRIQEAEAVQLVRDILLTPADTMWHVRRYSMTITNSIVYGTRNKDIESPHMREMFELQSRWGRVMEVGAAPPVDFFPWMKYLPESWLGSWIEKARNVGDSQESFYNRRADEVIERRRIGHQMNSLMDNVLDNREKNNLNSRQIAFLGGVLLEGGSETTVSVLLTILKALMKYPHVQERAQRQIDAVVGEERSPRWSDFEELPYINMIMKEAHRWRANIPLGVPHALGEDVWVDSGDGDGALFLPKGSTLITNVWGLHMDENTWKQPEEFIPERYEGYTHLASHYTAAAWDKRDHYTFGTSNRFCSGIQIAERTTFLAVAKLLWAYTFTQEVGPGGELAPNDCDPITGYANGLTVMPKDFLIRATIRSEKRRETILKEFSEAEKLVFCGYTAG